MAELRDMITPSGYDKLRAELDALWKDERPRVTAEVSAAAALGDRSENAEYIYGKKRLREIDRRVRWLRKRIESLTIVRSPTSGEPERVAFGVCVALEDGEGESITYQIVGTDEFDVDSGKISVASPIAQALIGKEVGDEVEVHVPKGTVYYSIEGLSYPSH